MVQSAASILLNLADFKELPIDSDNCGPELLFEFPIINHLGLQPPTPALLLQKYSHIIAFPVYFGDLYNVLNEMKDIDNQIVIETSQLKSAREKMKITKVLARKKVEVLEVFLRENRGKLTAEGFELLMPYIKDLFKDPITTVQAAWSILRHVGKELSPADVSKNLMSYLTQLFSGESSTPKHMKLYHRSFLVPLCLTIGLEAFLSNFSTLMVEAVAGYKDFDVLEDAMLNDLDKQDDEDEEEFFHSNQSYQEDGEDGQGGNEVLQPIEEGDHQNNNLLL